ncbi:MAG: cation diffusion facilitator family transporter [Bacteroidales bacterium]|nr:cation diffusion facilitator family transporter [Bacteroidales bacterium]
MKEELSSSDRRIDDICRITWLGAFVNLLLVAVKFVAGIAGLSAAMVADAIHSLSDLATDAIVIIFVKLSNKPADSDHDYGHGKYETFATLIIGTLLAIVGIGMMWGGGEKILDILSGTMIPTPGWTAFAAGIASIVAKETIFQYTMHVARRTHSNTLAANAWHHRSDALSSVGTCAGIGGAIILGNDWVILDPLAAVVVSVIVTVSALKIMRTAVNELLEKSLPENIERDILDIVAEDTILQNVHHLRTRAIGSIYTIDMHVRMPGDMTLSEAHRHTILLEQRLRQAYGKGTIINIHIEPLKVNGVYPE